MLRVPKKTIAVTVKMTEKDMQLFTRVAETVWRGAIMTQSALVLSLAKVGAETLLKDSAGHRHARLGTGPNNA